MDIINARAIIDQKYAAFGFKILSETVTLLDHIKGNGLDLDELVKAVKVFREHRQKYSGIIISMDCPECKGKMIPRPDGEDGFEFYCRKCSFGIYIQEPLHEYIKKLVEVKNE